MIYLASPYSHPDLLVMKTRFLLAEQVTAKFLIGRKHIYSPIVHCHELALRYDLPKDFDFWRSYNIDMLRLCEGLYVLAIPGWDVSKGVQEEIAFATSAGIPIDYVNEEGNYQWPK